MSRTHKHTKKAFLKKLIEIDTKEDWDFLYPPAKSFKRLRKKSLKAKEKQKLRNEEYEFDPDRNSHQYWWSMDW